MRNFEDLKIAVAGTGYVGLSIATLLACGIHVRLAEYSRHAVDALLAGESAFGSARPPAGETGLLTHP